MKKIMMIVIALMFCSAICHANKTTVTLLEKQCTWGDLIEVAMVNRIKDGNKVTNLLIISPPGDSDIDFSEELFSTVEFSSKSHSFSCTTDIGGNPTIILKNKNTKKEFDWWYSYEDYTWRPGNDELVAQAEDEFRLAMELISSDNPQDIKEGIIHAQKSLELKPGQPRPTCAIGTAHRKLEDYDKAIKWYNQAIKLNLEYTVCYDNLGLAYHSKMITATSDADREDSFIKAQDAFLKAVELDSTYADAHYNLGELYSWLDDDAARRKAIEEFETFIKLTDNQEMKQIAQEAVLKLKKEL